MKSNISSAGELSPAEVFSYAMERILTRPYSVKELTEKLQKKFQDASILITETIERLKELGYLNDTKYAELLVKNRLHIKRKGFYVITQELKNVQIPLETIYDLQTRYEEEEELSLQCAFEKKNAQISPTLPLQKRKEKLLGHLQRRGFSIQKIVELIKTLT